MPTTLPRTQVTHTPDVERALQVAHTRWPDESRASVLIARLAAEGADVVAQQVRPSERLLTFSSRSGRTLTTQAVLDAQNEE
ncbi:MAG: hypothetical protein FWG11_00835 [Promicromonosporaceae bacterium]|nr:hypothetical protein [Promicromonosporaceae bacterium]